MPDAKHSPCCHAHNRISNSAVLKEEEEEEGGGGGSGVGGGGGRGVGGGGGGGVPKNSGALLIGLPELHLDIAELKMSGLQ